MRKAYLVDVHGRLPEGVLLLVEVSHTNFSKVTGMVLVEICNRDERKFSTMTIGILTGSVMVLTAGQTTTTGMLPARDYQSIEYAGEYEKTTYCFPTRP